MREGYPRIVDRAQTRLSPWASLVEKHVVFADGEAPRIYHCLTQADYVGVMAVTADGRVPIVRQFRPAVEGFTWEFPAGTVDAGETPAAAARRELLEETSLETDELVDLGTMLPDTGRLQVRSHAFFARVSPSAVAQPTEEGLEVRMVTLPELHAMIRNGQFNHQLHLGVYAAALVSGACGELG